MNNQVTYGKMHSRTGTRTCCKAKAKDLTFKAKAKDLSSKAKDMKIVLKDSLRTRPRTNITANRKSYMSF